MRHSIILGCSLVFFGTGLTHASVPPQSPEKPLSAAAAKANAAEEAEREANALSRAQDYAVENYQRNMSRLAAEEERARAEAAAGEARNKRLVRRMAAAARKKGRAKSAADEMSPEQKAKKEAEALAEAQDRVVAYYKRSLGIETTVKRAPRGVEKLTCFTGVRDRHARMGVHLVNGKVNYFAFYSKWKPLTCSIYVERASASWVDNGTVSKVTFVDGKGVLVIHRTDESYRFDFKNVDRMRYCGMDGKINGSLTVRRGQKSCIVKGIMDGHQG